MDPVTLLLSRRYADTQVADTAGVSAKRFGVKGDGVTDDRPALQAAVNWAAENGVPLVVPAGVYRLSAQVLQTVRAITVQNNLTLIGYGPGRTVFKLADDAPDNAKVFWGSSNVGNNVHLKGFTVDGNRERSASNYNADSECINLVGSHILIEDVECINSLGEGIENDGGSSWTLIRCVVKDCAGDGIQMAGAGIKDIFLSDCYVDNCAWERSLNRLGGYTLSGDENIVLSGCTANNCPYGFTIDGQSGDSEVTLIGCYASDWSVRGISVQYNAKEVKITGCTLKGTREGSGPGIVIAAGIEDAQVLNCTVEAQSQGIEVVAPDAVVSGCSVTSPADMSVAGAIYVTGNNCIVSDCRVTGGRRGINVTGERVIIRGNTISDPLEHAIRLTSAAVGSIVSNNQCLDSTIISQAPYALVIGNVVPSASTVTGEGAVEVNNIEVVS